MPNRPLVRLWNTNGIGIVVSYPSGVRYSNQVGGHSCVQPEIEGVYIPLSNELIEQETMLRDYFEGAKWNSWCASGIDIETANFIDSILALSYWTKIIKVDHTRLSDSCEAWIYVTVVRQPAEPPVEYRSLEGQGTTLSGEIIRDADYDISVISFPLYGFGECTGILTWCNSD